MDENSMHEVVYNPNTHEYILGEKIITKAQLSFLCMEISFSWKFRFHA